MVFRVDSFDVASVLVVIAQLSDQEIATDGLINHSVFLANTARPITSESMAKGFRFAQPFERMARCIFDQLVDPAQNATINRLPVKILFPRLL
jgi:hypothetical protein